MGLLPDGLVAYLESYDSVMQNFTTIGNDGRGTIASNPSCCIGGPGIKFKPRPIRNQNIAAVLLYVHRKEEGDIDLFVRVKLITAEEL